MSIVVGLVIGKHRVLAGDQRVSYGDGHKFDHAPKVYKLKTGLLGFTGSVEPESKLVTVLRKADDPTSLVLPKGSYEALFLSANGKAYIISDGKSLVNDNATVFAMGAAYQYAHGAILGACKARGVNIKRAKPKQMEWLARLGVRAAIEFNNTCGGRVQVKYLEVT